MARSAERTRIRYGGWRGSNAGIVARGKRGNFVGGGHWCVPFKGCLWKSVSVSVVYIAGGGFGVKRLLSGVWPAWQLRGTRAWRLSAHIPMRYDLLPQYYLQAAFR